MRKFKFFAKKIKTPDGTFDSKKEYERFLFLKSEEKKGHITDLTTQPEFEIIPKLTRLVFKKLKTKTKVIERVDERAAHYTADFQYTQGDKIIIEEVKSKATMLVRDYPLRRKLIKHKIAKWNKEAGYEKYIFNEII